MTSIINDRTVDFAPSYNYKQSAFEEAKITIPSGVSYIFMPKMQGAISYIDEDGTPIIPEKTISTAVVGKLYKVSIKQAPGTAIATIDGNEVDMKWVQLWKDGPKFAEHNVGASSATDKKYKNKSSFLPYLGVRMKIFFYLYANK